MATKATKVEESIHEETERIKSVKRIVKERSAVIDYSYIEQEEAATDNWKEHTFSHPEYTVRLATAFSGIGAIEHAFQRLKLKHQIVFAGDVDANCRKSYFANYALDESNWFSDIREFKRRDIMAW